MQEKEAQSAEEVQQRERELLERIQKAAACTYILPLGRDRFYRRYWLFPASAALFVEDDFFGVTEDMLMPQKPAPEGDPETPGAPQQQEPKQQEEKMEVDGGVKAEQGEGDAKPPQQDMEAVVAHSCGPPVNRPNQWAFYGSVQEVEELMEALNPRGHRENGLKEALQQEKERIVQLLDGTSAQRFNPTGRNNNLNEMFFVSSTC